MFSFDCVFLYINIKKNSFEKINNKQESENNNNNNKQVLEKNKIIHFYYDGN